MEVSGSINMEEPYEFNMPTGTSAMLFVLESPFSVMYIGSSSVMDGDVCRVEGNAMPCPKIPTSVEV